MIKCNLCYQYQCFCNQTVPVNPVDLFGSPFDCRKQLRTKRFTSPNSPLPQDQLDELQACIEAINHILRSLGTESVPNNTRQLQLHFLDLKGISVKANILCDFGIAEDEASLVNAELIDIEDITEADDVELEIMMAAKIKKTRNRKKGNEDHSKVNSPKILLKKGKLATAGRDFVQINPVGSALFILYSRLHSITRHECDEEERDPKFINSDQETRRELAFNFGEYVSKNSDIENLFFGIPLYKALNKYVGKEVKILTIDEFFSGTLIDVNEGRIHIQNKKTKSEIDIASICYLKVLNLK
ncbi:hypothetical protein [Ureibacillus manganicus]|uniref:Uncharacterized protein n=1 Tax=Ureibacillus manganicus DSM 26584 TaxID=1384049 RepID=A0A0A3I5X7_9BACL|nr:hypothetical protein [Ureibacillus manganicus]KGR78910.1 hypothetical protein CD29_09570 [Ureibacillus manganicus DSM 26584]